MEEPWSSFQDKLSFGGSSPLPVMSSHDYKMRRNHTKEDLRPWPVRTFSRGFSLERHQCHPRGTDPFCTLLCRSPEETASPGRQILSLSWVKKQSQHIDGGSYPTPVWRNRKQTRRSTREHLSFLPSRQKCWLLERVTALCLSFLMCKLQPHLAVIRTT